MEINWGSNLNIASLPPGSERSILGYAGESLVIGRALLCGYNLFFKAWRDSKYDAVLDHLGFLYRIEIKQSRDGRNFSVTSGGRSGVQIDRGSVSREQIVSPIDCDFLVAVHSLSGKCWVVPTEVIAILGRRTLSAETLSPYEEAWKLFTLIPEIIGRVANPSNLRTLELDELVLVAKKVGINADPPGAMRIGQRTIVYLANDIDRYVIAIWEQLARMAQGSVS